METTIIMPHRPLSPGHLSTGKGPLYQLPDGCWQEGNNPPVPEDHYREDIHRGIYFLRKNSNFNHNVLVAMDADVCPQNWWLKSYDGVSIFKSPYVPKGDESPLSYYRLAAAYRDSINSLPDDEWICYGYTSDLICNKGWDGYIVEAINKYGDDKVYIPLFVETRSGGGAPPFDSIWDMEATSQLIWYDLRDHICCHALTMPEPSSRELSEEDFNSYIKKIGPCPLGDIIIEPCGARSWLYYDIMFMKAKYAKQAGFSLGFGFDIDFDNRLGALGLQKVGVTKSFILHCWVKFRWRDSTKLV